MNNNEKTTDVSVKIEKKYVFKFIVSAVFGLGSFMLPLPFFNNKTLVAYLSALLTNTFKGFLIYFAGAIIIFSAIMSILGIFLGDDTKYGKKIRSMFSPKPLYVITKIIAGVFMVMILADVDIPIITSADTGQTMLDLGVSLIAIAITLSYVLPFLTDCGIMELFGVLTKDLITPLFKVPGVASLDLITSWFGASNAEVILCREKYHMGYYNKKETAIIMSNFSLVSVSFCYVVTSATHLSGSFTLIFLSACGISALLAIIMPRLAPLKNIHETYYDRKKEVDTSVPKGWTSLSWGLFQSCERTKKFTLRNIGRNGTGVMLSIWFDLIPVVIAWGTLGLIAVYYTPVFTWLSYPLKLILPFLGLESVSVAAPAALVGFIDMFIPALLIAGVESVKTRFIITLLSLVQMIYLTEVGTVMMQSNIGLTFPKTLAIFLERTVLSFPIILILANIIY
ncbi:membrane protein [Spirochaetia bacterium]|nr:membrane protein [Spirochaetia bacterium]